MNKKLLISAVVTTLLLTLSVSNVNATQKKLNNRDAFLKAETNTTDDPRRVPMPEGLFEPQGSTVLVGGRVFDGTGSSARFATVVLTGKKVSAILSPDSKAWPEGAKVINVDGKTVMPGLIDLHVHMAYEEQGGMFPSHSSEADAALRSVERLRYYIESGITTVRDVGSPGHVPFRLKSWVVQNRLPLPRIYAAGQIIVGRGGHGTEGQTAEEVERKGLARIAIGPDDWREAVREQFAKGADLIKIGSHFSTQEIKAAVDEAHSLGIKVTVDAETFYVKRAIEAGADMIEHPLPRSPETIKLMAKNGVESIPTLIPYQIIFDLMGGYYGSTSRRFTFDEASIRQMLKDFKKAGIKMGIGTDLVADWFRRLPTAYVLELKEFVKAGYSISEALVAATKTNAEILDMGNKLGTIEVGKLADLIVVDGKPDEDLDDLVNIDLVIRNGFVVVKDGRTYTPRHKEKSVNGWPGIKPANSKMADSIASDK